MLRVVWLRGDRKFADDLQLAVNEEVPPERWAALPKWKQDTLLRTRRAKIVDTPNKNGQVKARRKSTKRRKRRKATKHAGN